jgi:hypothetical protein
MSTYTHTGRKSDVGYAHRGSLFGHDLPTPGVTHACNYHDCPRWVGQRYRTLCGKILGGSATIYTDTAGHPVTCRRCLKAMRGREP